MTIPGMTPAKIVDIATRRTKQRGATTIDVNNELLMVIQDLCGLAKWEWRKKRATVSLVVNTQVYDLTATGVDMQDLESIESVQLISSTLAVSNMVQVFDHHEQSKILSNTEQGKPLKYFQRASIYDLVIYPRADNVYAPDGDLVISYWAIPPTVESAPGTLLTTVPLIPAFLHRTLVKGLEAQILRYTLGEDSANYTNAQAEYALQVKALMPQSA